MCLETPTIKMNIRYKITLQFTILVLVILLIFTIGIYFFSSNYRDKDYNSRLTDRAKTVANLFLGVKEVDENLLKIIDRNTLALYHEQIFILDDTNRQIYCNTNAKFSRFDLVPAIRKNIEFKFRENERDCVGIVYNNNHKNYVVVASAYDYFGKAKLRYLRVVMIVSFLSALMLAIFVGFLFSGRALQPISSIVKQVKKITISNLNSRVDEGNQKDEIAQLAITFNQMLQRIEEAFILQRDFVSNAAHELRTPFAVLLAEIDYSLLQPRKNEYYREVLNNQRHELTRLSRLSNGLLDLARVSYDTNNLELKTIRIDELLVEACKEVISNKKEYNIDIDFSGLPDIDNKLFVSCNEQLLKIAINNLIENACKFSEDKTVKILFSTHSQFVTLHFVDQGIGIAPEDLQQIFQPFFRGKNTQFIAGYGLGLALTLKIVELHKGKLTVESTVGKGTTFVLTLPNRIYF